MKCAKCQIRDAEPDSLYCSKCKKGYYDSLDSFYKEYYTFERFYQSEINGLPKIRALVLLDDVLLTYRYYKEYGVFEPVLDGDLGYENEHKKAEELFLNLFASILEERLKAIGKDVNKELVNQFKEFREVVWSLTKHSLSDSSYFGFTESFVLFIRKVLRSKNINMNTDFVVELGNFFETGSAVFLLELFSELVSAEDSKVRNFIKNVKKLSEMYGDRAFHRVVNFPVVLLKPWGHQEKAFARWCENGFKGIIEMATATGKTLVGLMAIQKFAAEMERQNKNGIALIASHSRAILNQWKWEAIEKLGLSRGYGDYKIPIRGEFVKIEFETIQSLIRSDEVKNVDLLIVDEVHHIAAPEFRKVFEKVRFEWFMGLSASPSEGYRLNVFKEMGLYPPVFTFGLKEAIESGVLPEFEWYLHPVYLSEEEIEEFAQLSNQIIREFLRIKEDEETKSFLEKLDEDPDFIVTIEDFIRMIEKARFKKVEVPDSWKKLARLITHRRWLIHRSRPKIEDAIEMAKEYYYNGKKTIIFAMDIESCEYIKEKLSDEIDNVFIIHSKVSNPYEVLKSFKEAKNGILIGARMLDEGLDIPDAEVGLNVAASKTRIQLIQRLGRILRKHGDKKPVFHHFVGVPHKRSFVEFEDPFWILDEVSWVLDTALRMGFNAKIIERDEDIRELIRKSEKKVREYSTLSTVKLPSYGVLKLDNILSQFSETAIKNLIKILEAMPESKEISDEEWLNIMSRSLEDEKRRNFNVKGHWWLLVLGERNPDKIREILQRFLKSRSPI